MSKFVNTCINTCMSCTMRHNENEIWIIDSLWLLFKRIQVWQLFACISQSKCGQAFFYIEDVNLDGYLDRVL